MVSYHVEKANERPVPGQIGNSIFAHWQFFWFCPVGPIGTTTMAAHSSTPLSTVLLCPASVRLTLHMNLQPKHSKLNFPGIIISNVGGTYRYILHWCHIMYGSQTLPIIQFPSLTKYANLKRNQKLISGKGLHKNDLGGAITLCRQETHRYYYHVWSIVTVTYSRTWWSRIS